MEILGGCIAPCGWEKKSGRKVALLGARLKKRDVIVGVAQRRQCQSRMEFESEGKQMSGNCSFSSDLTRKQGSRIGSFQSAAEMGNELPGCSEMPLSNSTVNGELHNSEVLNNLSLSISQLISSLSFIKGMSANQINANMQDVSSVWTVPDQQTNHTFKSVNVTAAETSHMDRSNANKQNVPEICMKENMPCTSSPLGFHLSTTVKEKIWNEELFIFIITSIQQRISKT